MCDKTMESSSQLIIMQFLTPTKVQELHSNDKNKAWIMSMSILRHLFTFNHFQSTRIGDEHFINNSSPIFDGNIRLHLAITSLVLAFGRELTGNIRHRIRFFSSLTTSQEKIKQ